MVDLVLRVMEISLDESFGFDSVYIVKDEEPVQEGYVALVMYQIINGKKVPCFLDTASLILARALNITDRIKSTDQSASLSFDGKLIDPDNLVGYSFGYSHPNPYRTRVDLENALKSSEYNFKNFQNLCIEPKDIGIFIN